jgi:hypothetical protein
MTPINFWASSISVNAFEVWTYVRLNCHEPSWTDQPAAENDAKPCITILAPIARASENWTICMCPENVSESHSSLCSSSNSWVVIVVSWMADTLMILVCGFWCVLMLQLTLCVGRVYVLLFTVRVANFHWLIGEEVISCPTLTCLGIEHAWCYAVQFLHWPRRGRTSETKWDSVQTGPCQH